MCISKKAWAQTIQKLIFEDTAYPILYKYLAGFVNLYPLTMVDFAVRKISVVV